MNSVVPAAGTVPFPHAEVTDLVGMIIAKKFVRKRGLRNIGVIYLFGVDQLPEDEVVIDPTLPLPARAPMAMAVAMDALLPDLQRLEAMGAQCGTPEGAAAGLFGGFDWKALLGKLLPLILTLLGSA